jgi:nitrite reductase (NO-forming) / hydroxylamine reductase
MKSYKLWFLLWLMIGLVIFNCKEKDNTKELSEKGKLVFQSKGCIGCHSFGGGDSATGPDLKGVTQRRTEDWLNRWIKDPAGMLKSDSAAQELAKKYPNAMPSLPVDDNELKQLVAYFKSQDGEAPKTAKFEPLSDKEFSEAKDIFFQRCSGCHGAKRWGATGPSLLPDSHIKNASEIAGGGTRSKGTEGLEAILYNGLPGGMPPWGKEGVLDKRQINLMARYIQMTPPEVPKLDMEIAKANWKVIVPVKDRPTIDPTNGKFKNYFGVVMRDAGKVAIIDGETKEKLAVVDTGYAVHILRSSHSGRYFYSIGRDGKLNLIDLWYKEPKVVAESRACWDARSVDGSKAHGYEDKYAIVGCYTPNQYVIFDGQTLEPLSVTSVSDSKDQETGKPLPEVRVASIVASEEKPFWVINLKESGWVYMIDYTNPKEPKEKRLKADNFLHDGGWVNIPGQKEKRYFLVAANGKNKLCVVDTVKGEVQRPCIETGKVPHPGRGANFVHPKYGSVYATTHISDDTMVLVGVDPDKQKKYAWKVVDTIKIKSAGSLFVKTHPKSENVWFDMPLSSKEGVNGEVGVYNIKTGEIQYIKVSPNRVVHFEYNVDGNEVWISGWLENAIYIYDDKTLKLKKKITGDWVKTPTGKFNVVNTSKDIY